MGCYTEAREKYKDMPASHEKFELIRAYVKACEEQKIAEMEEQGLLPEPTIPESLQNIYAPAPSPSEPTTPEPETDETPTLALEPSEWGIESILMLIVLGLGILLVVTS